MVALGGALGSVARFGLSNLIALRYAGSFPLATLIVNVTGSLAIGYLAATTTSQSARNFLMIGVCGGYTTFSAFSLQNLQFIQNGNIYYAGLNAALSLLLCMGGVWVGYVAGSALSVQK
jgi:CrcB protein